MIINGLKYCDLCHLSILSQRHVEFKKYGTNPPQYEHYHNRFAGDCWDKVLRETGKKIKVVKKGGV